MNFFTKLYRRFMRPLATGYIAKKIRRYREKRERGRVLDHALEEVEDFIRGEGEKP